jgi:hypothetical protein
VIDLMGQCFGVRRRLWACSIVLFLESLAAVLFSRMKVLNAVIPAVLILPTFKQMPEGATFDFLLLFRLGDHWCHLRRCQRR